MNLFMKPLVTSLCLLLVVSACSKVAIPKEGEQYHKLATPLSSELLSPVTEVFSLTCSHCRNMEQYLGQISQQAGAEIGKIHTTFNRAADTKAQLYYAAEIQLNTPPDSVFMASLFAAIRHPKKQVQGAIANTFATHKLTPPEQLSEQQNQQLRDKINKVRNFTQIAGINSVPAFIVNGRYQVILKGHKTPSEIGETIKYLLTLE